MRKPKTYPVTVAIPADKIEDILYGHGTYPWMQSAVGQWKRGGIRCKFDAEDGEEGDGNGRKVLKRADVLEGLAVMARETPHQFGQFMEGNPDMNTADCFYQCAIFGKLVYA